MIDHSTRWITVLSLLVLGAAASSVRRAAKDVRAPVDAAAAAYATSDACASCHPFRHATWERTFHRTMTQEAVPGAVLGDFENATYTYRGVTSQFTREGDRHFIETLSAQDPDSGRHERYQVVMTVGSRRVQQYVTRIGDRHFRLPLAWNIAEERWFHLAGGFLHPDGSDFHTHTGLWDANCIFCHNVKAQPGFDPRTETFASRVEEHGIACEACHGPGETHVARNHDPFRRYFLYLTGEDERDPTAVSPNELSAERQVQLCGHCHGQRLPSPRTRIQQFLMEGDPYTAGADLSEVTEPIDAHTELEGVDFSLRFWGDGTPRLTAYEYQSLLMTPDYEKGGLTCTHCHSMHGGDPRGMITDAMRGPEACASCHADVVRDVAAHARHEATGPGADCYACHMPKITYGLLATHPTHRIAVPDPSRAWKHDMPEACTLCHTNETAAWAAAKREELWLAPDGEPAASAGPAPAPIPEGGDFAEVAECVRALLAGDVVQRAVAANALAAGVPYSEDGSPLWAAPFLLLTLQDDYPAIRHFAARGLRDLLEREGVTPPRGADAFDALAEPEARAAIVDRWWAWWAGLDKRDLVPPGRAVPLDEDWLPRADTVARLKARQDDRIIAIGE